jgi:hypothetical protein
MTAITFGDNWFENQIDGFQVGRIELLKIDFFGENQVWFYERIRGRFL